MFNQIAFQIYFGLPLVAWGGLATLVSLLIAATMGYLLHSGRANFPLVWHVRAAIISLMMGVFHGLIAMLAILGF